MYIFTIPREKFDERAPDKRIIRRLISKHISQVGDLKKNMAYYQGKHKILEDAKRETGWYATMQRTFQTQPAVILSEILLLISQMLI